MEGGSCQLWGGVQGVGLRWVQSSIPAFWFWASLGIQEEIHLVNPSLVPTGAATEV